MKSLVRKIALTLTSLFTLVGFSKAKPTEEIPQKKARQRVIVLDEHEFSAFHRN